MLKKKKAVDDSGSGVKPNIKTFVLTMRILSRVWAVCVDLLGGLLRKLSVE